MAIDEVESETVELQDKITLETIQGKCEIITVEENNCGISEKPIKEGNVATINKLNYTTDEQDDDIIFLENHRFDTIILTDDEDIQEQQISLRKFADNVEKNDKISNKNSIFDSPVSDVGPDVEENLDDFCSLPKIKPPLRQYGRKAKKNVVSSQVPNENNLFPSIFTENSEIGLLSEKSGPLPENQNLPCEQNTDDGLKTLAELPDFILSNESTNTPTASTNLALSTPVAKEIEETQKEQKMEDRCDDIKFHLTEIFKKNNVEIQTSPVIVRIDNKPVIISENGVVTVIYKPEKVNFRGNIDNFETNISNRSSPCIEARTETNRSKKETYNSNKSSNELAIWNHKTKILKNKLIRADNQELGPGDVEERAVSGLKVLKRKYPPICKIKYRGDWVYKCPDCDFIHPSQVTSLRRHMLRHQPAESIDWFYCNLCEYRAKRKGNLKVHMILHRNPDEVVWYKCEICDKKFKHKNGLKSHEKRHVKREELELYLCNKCPYKTPFKHTLLRHKINHEPRDKKTVLRCSNCSYSTFNKYYFARHKQTHGEPLYKCLLCSYQAKYKVNLESHMKRHYPQEEMLYCDLCNYSTNRKYTLTLHNRNVHNIFTTEEDQTLFCYTCSFQTRFKRCLVKHMQIHYGNKEIIPRIKTETTTDD